MIKASVKMDLRFPEIATQKILQRIMTGIIKPDVEGRMRAGTDIEGNPHKPNAPQTRINKGLRGFPSGVPLIASGQLNKSFVINLKGDNAVVMYPAGIRRPYPSVARSNRGRPAGAQRVMGNNELADILQNQGVHGHKYPFFGISQKAEEEAVQLVKNIIQKEIDKNAGRKTV
jgi:hypothetical protein